MAEGMWAVGAEPPEASPFPVPCLLLAGGGLLTHGRLTDGPRICPHFADVHFSVTDVLTQFAHFEGVARTVHFTAVQA